MENYNEFDKPSEFGPTGQSGVYGVFITTKIKTRCIYIGSSQNISKRVLKESHIYRICCQRLTKNGALVYTRQINTSNYLQIEKELIRKYKPLLNKIRYGT